jgi:hypothetical protein
LGAHPNKLDLILLKEQDLVGLEDDSDFWNMEIDTSSVLATESSPKKEDITAGTSHANPRATATCTLPSGPRWRKKDIQTYLRGSCKIFGL